MSWIDFNGPFRSLYAALPTADLSACLPTPPAGSVRPPILSDAATLRSPFCWPTAHFLLTSLAVGEQRRRQKRRANGWQPALLKLPPAERLAPAGLNATKQAVKDGTIEKLLGKDLDLLVQLTWQTRCRLLANDPKADEWADGLRSLLGRAWAWVDAASKATGWTPEQTLAWFEKALRACWRRIFNCRPPAVLFPPLPTEPDLDQDALDALRRASHAALWARGA